MDEQQFTFNFREDQAQRLDKFLVTCLPNYSRSRLQGLIKDEQVRVNGILARKAGQLLEKPAVVDVMIPPPQPTELTPEPIPLDILFENKDVLVINKPAGMVVHPAAGHATGTLVHATLAYAADLEGIGGELRPGVVHRLDKNTSGLILVAKNEPAQRWLQGQFRDRKVTKLYLTLVDGRPPTPTGRVETPIGRSSANRKQMAVVPPSKGREAITEYRLLEAFLKHAFLEVHPITGRTHQIRIHMAFLGCPVVGDTIYGFHKPSIPLNRHFLHAWRLTIRLPGEPGSRTFEAPLPAELDTILTAMR